MEFDGCLVASLFHAVNFVVDAAKYAIGCVSFEEFVNEFDVGDAVLEAASARGCPCFGEDEVSRRPFQVVNHNHRCVALADFHLVTPFCETFQEVYDSGWI